MFRILLAALFAWTAVAAPVTITLTYIAEPASLVDSFEYTLYGDTYTYANHTDLAILGGEAVLPLNFGPKSVYDSASLTAYDGFGHLYLRSSKGGVPVLSVTSPITRIKREYSGPVTIDFRDLLGNYFELDATLTITPPDAFNVPEPSSYAMLVTGLGVLVLRSRAGKRKLA